MRQKPPAPRKVGRPEAAERPAPQRARMRVDFSRWAVKEVRSGWEIAGLVVVLMVRRVWLVSIRSRESCMPRCLQGIGCVVELARRYEAETRTSSLQVGLSPGSL